VGDAHIVGSKQGEKRRSLGSGFDCGAAIHFLSVDQAKNTDDLKCSITGGLNCLDGGGAGGADIVDDDDAGAGLVKTFNAAAGAVGLF
jgi:hypothetical protein